MAESEYKDQRVSYRYYYCGRDIPITNKCPYCDPNLILRVEDVYKG